MRRRQQFGVAVLGVAALALLLGGVGQARAASVFAISITITDHTTSTTTVFTIQDGDPFDNNPSTDVIQPPDFISDLTGVSLTGLTATSSSTPAGTMLDISGTATPKIGVSDSYTVAIITTHDTYTQPPGILSAILSQSESGTYTFTLPGGDQLFQSWYSPTNTANDMTDGTPGQMTIPIPSAGFTPVSRSANTPGSTTISPFVLPYALTNQITFDVTGNGTADNSSIQFNGFTSLGPTPTVTGVPEPASLTLLATGALGLLGCAWRKRKQAAA